ncbi:MAG TPA: translation elongation factor Ts [Anaerolineae bacterium]|nr:translation elongation factor Ts [Anaerolineae bacterium]
MEITVNMVKELREKTGAGVLDCKNMLIQTDGDMDQAVERLREKGLASAAKKMDREASEGLIGYYIHPGERLAALVEVNCETDFVARTPEFGSLAHDMAMQVAASAAQYVSIEDIPEEVLAEQEAEYRKQMIEEGKPERILDRIVEGKIQKFYEQVCLLEQPFIKDEDKKVGELLKEMIANLGENIVLRRFSRLEVGE